MNYTVTLLSDWKLRDPYIALVKATIMSVFEKINIVDISHAITNDDIQQSAFILKNSYHYFNENSIHINLTTLSISSSPDFIVLKCNNHIFIGEDNGQFYKIIEDNDNDYDYDYEVYIYKSEQLLLMQIKDLLSLIINGNLETLEKTTKLKRLVVMQPDYRDNNITGYIAHVDSKCNAITNISVDMFNSIRKSRNFECLFGENKDLTTNIYYEIYNRSKNIIYLTNLLNFISLTMYRGSIAALASLNIGDSIEINFID